MTSTSVWTPPITVIEASSTAGLRSTYIPPFATSATFVASSATTQSRASGSLALPTVSGHPANPTTPAFQNDLDWVSAYLLIHSLSQNSYVYAYIFWFFVALIFAFLSLLQNTGARGGVLGAWWSKWALRRRTWRKAVSQTAHRQPWSLPSNAQLLSLVCLSVAVAALCVAGPNYLNPRTGLFNFSLPQDSITKRDSDFNPSILQFFQAQYTISKSLWSSAARAGEISVMLLPLTVLLALKAPPFAIFAIPYTAQLHFDKLVRLHRWAGRLVFLVVLAHVVMWCIELSRNRRPSTGELVWHYVFLYNKFIFGWVAFGSLTILTLLSLRPIRTLRYPIFYNSHLILTPVVLVFTALHHPPVWWWAWSALFIWVGERLWRATFWVYVNGLFGVNDNKKWTAPPTHAQRNISGESGNSVTEKRPSYGFKNKHDSVSTGQESFEMSPISPTPRRPPGRDSLAPHTSSETLSPPNRASFGFWDPRYLDRDGTHTPSYSIDSIAYDGDDRGGAGTPLSFNSKVALAAPIGSPGLPPSPAPGVNALARNAIPYAPQDPVPPGFAHATLLPGRTVRLRVLPRGAFSWAPGQHVLIGVPAVSKLSTHPFSIASVCDELAGAAEADSPAAEKGEGRKGDDNQVHISHNGLELVILVRAKKGWTRRLWNMVEDMQARGERVLPSEVSQLPTGYTPPSVDRRASGGINVTGGVLLRTLIDGPFGSTARTRWGDYSSVLIVAGGSGVSYGVSILEYYCLCLSGRDGRYLGTRISGSPWHKGGWKTERVRFVWLVREYSHIQWCASSLRRCLALLHSSHALEINIYVTHYKPPREIRHSSHSQPGVAQLAAEEGMNTDLLLPPAPRFAQKSRRERPTSNASSLMSDSESSIGSEDSDNSYVDTDYDFDNFGDHREGADAAKHEGSSHDGHDSGLGHEEHVLDYTNFDGDDDEPLPGESHLSRKLKKEGKLRRAKTKKTLKARLAKKALDVRSSFIHGSGSKTPAGADIPQARPSSSVAIEVYPDTPRRAPALSSDPLLATSSTSPPTSPREVGADGEHGGHFAAMQSLTPSRLSTAPSSRLSVAGDDGAHGAQRPSLTVRPLSGASTFSNASSLEMRSPIDRDGRWLDLQDGKLAIGQQELQDIRIISEVAHPGKPKLDRILQNEVEDSKGRLAVCCCGPTSLNALMRKYVAAQISPSKILKGDMRGSIDFITEDFEY